MKCEKHGVEMEWRGSLVTGHMHCEQCSAVGGMPYAEIAKGLLAPEFKEALDGRFVLDAKRRDAKIPPMPAPTMSANAQRHMARARIQAADAMLARHQRGADAFCPYCVRMQPPEHTQHNADNGGDCCAKYWEDSKIA